MEPLLRKNSWLMAVWLLCMGSAYAQNEQGLLNIRNYTPKNYGAHPQNFCFTQDERGVIFAGNNRGVLEYDGYRWKLHKTKNEAAVTALYADKNFRLLVGGINELGYLAPGSKGSFVYTSLVNKIPEKNRGFDKVLKIYAIGEKRIYQTRSYLFILEKDKISVVTPPTDMGISFAVGKHIYVNLSDTGLHEFDGSALRMVNGGEIFKGKTLFGVAPYDGKLLVCTESEMYIKTNSGFEKIPAPVTNINSVESLGEQLYAFGLFGDGLVITDRNLKIKYAFGLNNGLQDGTVNSIFLDRENNLWVALNRGIDKVEAFSPINLFNYNVGLKGGVESIIRHKGQLYVATYNGVFYFNSSTQRFVPVQNLSLDCYGMDEFISGADTMLFVAGVDGVYQVRDKRASLFAAGAPWNIFQSKTYSNRLFIGQDDGISSRVFIGGVWKDEKRIEGVTDPVSSLVEDDKYIWVGSRTSGVYRITSKTYSSLHPEWKKFDTQQGLPEGWTYVCSYEDRILFGTSKGIYEFNEEKQSFFRSELNPTFSKKSFGVHHISHDDYGRLWLSVYYENDNSYDICYLHNGTWVYKPFLKYNSDIVQTIYLEKEKVWLGTAFGLMRYDYSSFLNYDQPFTVIINDIRSVGNTVFNGFYTSDKSISTTQNIEFELPYASNDLSFEFSSPSYSDESFTRYRYFLEGYTKNWSHWQHVPTAAFTNLAEGDYVMMIKAVNIYGRESDITRFGFTILPPWYRTWWAYSLYVLLFIAFVYMAIRVSTRSLKRIIDERTAEVVHQKELVEEKNKDILDSIKYAKRIQEAMIPDVGKMREEITEDLFVFYRPKDIVSGDFYWMRPITEGVLFAAVDCTGHGVPGAFVSIIGNNGLNRAVNEFNLRKPGDILDKLSALTEEAFRQQGNSEVKDGMDCSLVLYRKKERILEFSGANNPLWILRKTNGVVEVMEFKADKQPIGRFDGRKPFTTHSIPLQPGDAIYLFSDGYADQFGGEGGKKFKYKQLKEILISIYDQPMKAQEKVIVDAFDNWKGSYEQLDDVCLIGVKAV